MGTHLDNNRDALRKGRNLNKGLSLFYGVQTIKKKNGVFYVVDLTVGDKTEFIGQFKEEIEAARVFDAVNLYRNGSNAKVNFSDSIALSPSQIKGNLYAEKKQKCTSKYVGVYFDDSKNKGVWVSQISIQNKTKFIGHHKSEIEAAMARDNYVKEHSLPHRLNFKDRQAMEAVHP
jgi:hypothetical protein